jgi:hypothetical protein
MLNGKRSRLPGAAVRWQRFSNFHPNYQKTGFLKNQGFSAAKFSDLIVGNQFGPRN